MKIGYKTDVGKKRDHNEDSLFVDEKQGLFIVADGMGGHQGGEVASKMAVDLLPPFIKEKLSKDTAHDEVSKILMESLFNANDEISKKADADPLLNGMGTTIVFALQRGEILYIANVGDSRAYLIKHKEIKQISEEHSVVAQMVKAGLITEEEAMTRKDKHIITQVIGSSEYLSPAVRLIKFEKGNYILLCSDGLTNMLANEEIISIIFKAKKNVKKACEMLVESANEKGGNDNITVILLYEEI